MQSRRCRQTNVHTQYTQHSAAVLRMDWMGRDDAWVARIIQIYVYLRAKYAYEKHTNIQTTITNAVIISRGSKEHTPQNYRSPIAGTILQVFRSRIQCYLKPQTYHALYKTIACVLVLFAI